MATNLTAKNIRLTIGGVDWSNYCTEATLQWDEVNLQDGIVKASGSFTLDVSEITPLPSYRRDPDQWAKGTEVLFETVDSLGNWVTPTFGALYIASPPIAPSVTNPIINLEAICVLSLFDFPQPPGDASGVTTGTPRNRNLIVADILEQNDATTSLTAIAYPFDYPVPRTGGSWVQQAGEIVGSAGHYLYQDSDRVIKNKEIDLSAAAIATVTIGTNEAEWEPSEGSETPLEKLIVGGVTYSTEANFGNSTVREVLGYRSDVLPGLIYPRVDAYVGVIERTTVTNEPYDPVTKSQTTTTTVELPRITVFGAIEAYSPFSSPSYELVVAKQSVDTNYYGDNGELIKQVCQKKRPRSSITRLRYLTGETIVSGSITIGLRGPDFTLLTEEETETVYTYNNDLIVSSLTISTKKPRYQFDTGVNERDDFDLAWSLITSSTVVNTWENLGGDRWLFTEGEKQELQRLDRTYNIYDQNGYVKTDLISVTPVYFTSAGTTVIANDGSADPPQTQYLKINTLTEEKITACVTFVGLEANPYGEREKDITVAYAVSKEQLYSFGTLYNSLIWGRRFGWRVGTAITDELLTALPLDRVDVTDGGDSYGLLIDGLTLVFSGNESYAAFNGIEVEYQGIPSFQKIITASGGMSTGITFTGEGEITSNVLSATVPITIVGFVEVNRNKAYGDMSAPITMTGLNASARTSITGLQGQTPVTSTGLSGKVEAAIS